MRCQLPLTKPFLPPKPAIAFPLPHLCRHYCSCSKTDKGTKSIWNIRLLGFFFWVSFPTHEWQCWHRKHGGNTPPMTRQDSLFSSDLQFDQPKVTVEIIPKRCHFLHLDWGNSRHRTDKHMKRTAHNFTYLCSLSPHITAYVLYTNTWTWAFLVSKEEWIFVRRIWNRYKTNPGCSIPSIFFPSQLLSPVIPNNALLSSSCQFFSWNYPSVSCSSPPQLNKTQDRLPLRCACHAMFYLLNHHFQSTSFLCTRHVHFSNYQFLQNLQESNLSALKSHQICLNSAKWFRSY